MTITLWEGLLKSTSVFDARPECGKRRPDAFCDADGALGREALSTLRETTDCHFNFVECDLETIDLAPGQPFDLVFARLILARVADPLELLRKMYSWVKPGGYLVTQEYDLRTPDIYPRLATWPEFELTPLLIGAWKCKPID